MVIEAAGNFCGSAIHVHEIRLPVGVMQTVITNII